MGPPYGGASLIVIAGLPRREDGAATIARVWHGRTLASKADAYVDYLHVSGVRELQGTPGNRGVFVLRHIGPLEADFYVMSLWDTMDAIERFAGDDVKKARYFDQDREFLLEFEPQVTHYEVCEAPSEL